MRIMIKVETTLNTQSIYRTPTERNCVLLAGQNLFFIHIFSRYEAEPITLFEWLTPYYM